MAEVEVGREVTTVVLAGRRLVDPQVSAVDLAALDEGDALQGCSGATHRAHQILQHGGVFVRLHAWIGVRLEGAVEEMGHAGQVGLGRCQAIPVQQVGGQMGKAAWALFRAANGGDGPAGLGEGLQHGLADDAAGAGDEQLSSGHGVSR